MYLESQLKAATNDYLHVMFIPKHQSCYVKADGDEAIVAGVKRIFQDKFLMHMSPQRSKKTN